MGDIVGDESKYFIRVRKQVFTQSTCDLMGKNIAINFQDFSL